MGTMRKLRVQSPQTRAIRKAVQRICSVTISRKYGEKRPDIRREPDGTRQRSLRPDGGNKTRIRIRGGGCCSGILA